MEILVLDIETANIDHAKDNWSVENCLICEIGIVNLNLDSGEIRPVFNHTCREDISPDAESWIFKNSSLTFKMVNESPHLRDFKDELQKIFNCKPVTSFNQKFDFKHLECPSRCLTIPLKYWDPMVILRDLLKIPHMTYRYKFPSGTEAYNYFNPENGLEQNHRALDDAKIAAYIIFQTVKKWPNLKNEYQKNIVNNF